MIYASFVKRGQMNIHVLFFRDMNVTHFTENVNRGQSVIRVEFWCTIEQKSLLV